MLLCGWVDVSSSFHRIWQIMDGRRRWRRWYRSYRRWACHQSHRLRPCRSLCRREWAYAGFGPPNPKWNLRWVPDSVRRFPSIPWSLLWNFPWHGHTRILREVSRSRPFVFSPIVHGLRFPASPHLGTCNWSRRRRNCFPRSGWGG